MAGLLKGILNAIILLTATFVINTSYATHISSVKWSM